MLEDKLKYEEWETRCQIREEILQEQLEGLWKTDFADSVVSSVVSPSTEDIRGLKTMEQLLKIVDGHYQVALPWRANPPYLPTNKIMAERRVALLKRRLLRDEGLFFKYNATMDEYVKEGHAERVPSAELRPDDRLV